MRVRPADILPVQPAMKFVFSVVAALCVSFVGASLQAADEEFTGDTGRRVHRGHSTLAMGCKEKMLTLESECRLREYDLRHLRKLSYVETEVTDGSVNAIEMLCPRLSIRGATILPLEMKVFPAISGSDGRWFLS